MHGVATKRSKTWCANQRSNADLSQKPVLQRKASSSGSLQAGIAMSANCQEKAREPSTGVIGLVFPLGCYKQNQYVLMTAAINFIVLHMVTFCTYPVVGLTESNRVYPFKVVNYYENAEPHGKIHSWMILSLGNIGNTFTKHTIKINK